MQIIASLSNLFNCVQVTVDDKSLLVEQSGIFRYIELRQDIVNYHIQIGVFEILTKGLFLNLS